MVHNVRIKSGCYQELTGIGTVWLNENLKEQWCFYGQGGAIFINLRIEEDKCLFILKYGEYIE